MWRRNLVKSAKSEIKVFGLLRSVKDCLDRCKELFLSMVWMNCQVHDTGQQPWHTEWKNAEMKHPFLNANQRYYWDFLYTEYECKHLWNPDFTVWSTCKIAQSDRAQHIIFYFLFDWSGCHVPHMHSNCHLTVNDSEPFKVLLGCNRHAK